MTLKESSEKILNQLIQLIDQLNENDYSTSLDILSGSSVGKHVRHIIEFYGCLLVGIETGTVNYDKRSRNRIVETDPDFTVQVLSDMLMRFRQMRFDKSLRLLIDLSTTESVSEIRTTYFRELAYNLEHAIHHMAIIKIATKVAFKHVHVDDNFGVAYSTINYQQQQSEKICE
jgi:hypothetical protein